MRQNYAKYALGLVTVIALRLMPHPPNVEPIMATMMPFAKRWGWLSGAAFTLLAIVSFDLLTGTLGVWTLATAGTYTALGAAAGIYLGKRKNTIANYVKFSIAGTLIYDAITGIGTGMLFFGQTFMETFTGQIPFTIYHLAGNVTLAMVVSPLLYRWVVDNPQLEMQALAKKIKAVAGI